jgi:hypothetical protein
MTEPLSLAGPVVDRRITNGSSTTDAMTNAPTQTFTFDTHIVFLSSLASYAESLR